MSTFRVCGHAWRGVATSLVCDGGEIGRANCLVGLQHRDLTVDLKFFSVHQVAPEGVAKWSMDVFNRFNGVRFSVAGCNNDFGSARFGRAWQESCNNGLEMRKNGE